jgi:signal transduction histidine kinase
LLEDLQGVLWIGTEKGLVRFEHNQFRAVPLSATVNGDQMVALAGGRTVRIFASTEGPALYTLRNDLFSSYDLGVTRPIDCFFLDHLRHTAWMGTLGAGLLRWQNGNIAHVRVKDGLYDNRIYNILDDGRGYFWMASSKGIFRVSRSELEALADGKGRLVKSVPFSTGQLRFECRSGVQPAACRTHDGRLWFSTTNGLVVVDPGRLTRSTVPPPVQITAVLVNGVRIATSRALKLTPSQRNVEIRYAGLSFVSPEKVTFRYKLEGFDKGWTEAGSRREAFFTNLPPKQFKFLVYGRNANGDLSVSPAALEFTVEPRLYQRVWFIPLLVVLIATGAFAGYRLRVKHLRQKFDLVLAERSRIARELHDTLLQGLSGVTMQLQALWMRMPPSRERQFLAGVIEDAGACSQEARQSLWDLRAQTTQREPFSEKLKSICSDIAQKSGISLKLDIEPVSLQALPETEYQLMRIAREAVTNAVAHANAAVLTVQLRVDRGQLRLSFEDNGIGFDAQNGVQLLGHFGLIGIRERAEEMGAELMVSSSPGKGTQIAVQLNLTKARRSQSNAEPHVEHQIR